jgi:hypothetical protein
MFDFSGSDYPSGRGRPPSLGRIVRGLVWSLFLLYTFVFFILAVVVARDRPDTPRLALAVMMEAAFFYFFAVCFAIDRIVS